MKRSNSFLNDIKKILFDEKIKKMNSNLSALNLRKKFSKNFYKIPLDTVLF